MDETDEPTGAQDPDRSRDQPLPGPNPQTRRPDAQPQSTSQTLVDERSASQFAIVGAAVAALVLVALVTIISLATDDGERDTVSTSDTTVRAPTVTYDPSVADRTVGKDIKITDEPIVIDADGEIVDINGGDGTASSSTADDDEGTGLDLPADLWSQAAKLEAEQAAAAAVTSGSTPPPPATTTGDGGLDLLGGDDPEDKKMPDLICRGLQAAQDEIQDHGVFGSKSEDATGKGRRQIWDRNWIVVAQDPDPGEKIGEFEAVLYVVKKDDAENPC